MTPRPPLFDETCAAPHRLADAGIYRRTRRGLPQQLLDSTRGVGVRHEFWWTERPGQFVGTVEPRALITTGIIAILEG